VVLTLELTVTKGEDGWGILDNFTSNILGPFSSVEEALGRWVRLNKHELGLTIKIKELSTVTCAFCEAEFSAGHYSYCPRCGTKLGLTGGMSNPNRTITREILPTEDEEE
jgi:hypothetical protein